MLNCAPANILADVGKKPIAKLKDKQEQMIKHVSNRI